MPAGSRVGGEGAREGTGKREETPEMGVGARGGRVRQPGSRERSSGDAVTPWGGGGQDPKRVPGGLERAGPKLGPALGVRECERDPRG